MKDSVTRLVLELQANEDESWSLRFGMASMQAPFAWEQGALRLPSYDAGLAAIRLTAGMLRTDVASKLTDRIDYAAEVAKRVLEEMP